MGCLKCTALIVLDGRFCQQVETDPENPPLHMWFRKPANQIYALQFARVCKQVFTVQRDTDSCGLATGIQPMNTPGRSVLQQEPQLPRTSACCHWRLVSGTWDHGGSGWGRSITRGSVIGEGLWRQNALSTDRCQPMPGPISTGDALHPSYAFCTVLSVQKTMSDGDMIHMIMHAAGVVC